MAAELIYEKHIRLAKQGIAEVTGETEPEVLRYGFDHGASVFTFRTALGVFSAAVGLDESVTLRREEPRTFLPAITAEPGAEGENRARLAAMERALGFVGEGLIRSVEGQEGGYVVEIGRSGAAPVRVFVDREGAVRESERPGVKLRLDIR